MNYTQDRELGWNDEIQKESTFTILPNGEYAFTVTNFERARHGGSAKLPACNKAVLTLSFPDGVEIKHNLFLHSKTEGLLSNFFICIGHKKPGEKLRMDWNRVRGSRGRAKIGVREWKDDYGRTREANDITEFLAPAENDIYQPPQQQYAPQPPQYQQSVQQQQYQQPVQKNYTQASKQTNKPLPF